MCVPLPVVLVVACCGHVRVIAHCPFHFMSSVSSDTFVAGYGPTAGGHVHKLYHKCWLGFVDVGLASLCRGVKELSA